MRHFIGGRQPVLMTSMSSLDERQVKERGRELSRPPSWGSLVDSHHQAPGTEGQGAWCTMMVPILLAICVTSAALMSISNAYLRWP